jgi:hypothetical protein
MLSKNSVLPTLTLFGSLSTLICCALPALMVSIGAGAALAGIVSTIPQLVWFSEHKVALFAVSGILILVSGIGRYVTRNAPCPIDPAQAKACMKLRRISAYVFYASVVIYATGFFFAFIAYRLL